MLKKQIGLLCLLGMIIGLARMLASNNDSDPIKPAITEITVAVDDNYPPLFFIDDRGNYQGYIKDKWLLWEELTGIKVRLIPMQWPTAKESLHLGYVDAIDTLRKVSNERNYAFVDNGLALAARLYYTKELTGIKDAFSAKGFAIAVKEGGACHDYLINIGHTEIITYPDYVSLMEAFLKDAMSVYCMSEYPAQYYTLKFRLADKIKQSPVLFVAQTHAAVRADNKQLRSVLNAGFSKISEESQDYLDDVWFGAPPYKGGMAIASQSEINLHAVLTVITAISVLILLIGWLKYKKAIVELANADLKLRDAAVHTKNVINNFSAIWLEVTPEGTCLSASDLLIPWTNSPASMLVGKSIWAELPNELSRTLSVMWAQVVEANLQQKFITTTINEVDYYLDIFLYAQQDSTDRNQFSLIIKNKTIYYELENLTHQLTHKLAMALAVIQALDAADSVKDLMFSACQAFSHISDCCSVIIYALTEDENEITPYAWHGLNAIGVSAKDELSISGIGSELIEHCKKIHQTQQSFVTTLELSTPSINATTPHSIRGMPIKIGKTAGVIVIITKVFNTFDSREPQTLIATLVASISKMSISIEQRNQAIVATTLRQAKESFLSVINFELRTPLNSIINLARLATTPYTQHNTTPKLKQLEESALQLLEASADMLTYAELEVGLSAYTETSFSLMAIANHISHTAKPLTDLKGLTLDIFFPYIDFDVIGDMHKISQALLNFVLKAVKLSQTGSIFTQCILFENRNDTVGVRFDVLSNTICKSISPLSSLNGEIDLCPPTATTPYGLILQLNKALLSDMKGDVNITELNETTTRFSITLRLPKARAAKQNNKLIIDNLKHKELLIAQKDEVRILVVEDDKLNRTVICELLRRVGLFVDIAEDGAIALRKVLSKATPYSLIIMDVMLPEMDGLSVTNSIRNHYTKQDLPIIALTANTIEADLNACLVAGMNAYLTKPFSPENLYRMVFEWTSARAKSNSLI